MVSGNPCEKISLPLRGPDQKVEKHWSRGPALPKDIWDAAGVGKRKIGRWPVSRQTRKGAQL